ncbi:hypothetical protein IG631_05938 [Alternaria alternata]|nr:hypothetical protein IG631_05938 [Alternaria alternata]
MCDPPENQGVLGVWLEKLDHLDIPNRSFCTGGLTKAKSVREWEVEIGGVQLAIANSCKSHSITAPPTV